MYEVSFSLTCCKHITTFKSSAFLQHSPQHFRGTTRRGMYNLSPCQISMYCLSIGICMCKLLSWGFSLWVIFLRYRSLKMLAQLNLLRSNCLHPKVSCAILDLNKMFTRYNIWYMYSLYCVLELSFEIHFSYFTEGKNCVTWHTHWTVILKTTWKS